MIIAGGTVVSSILSERVIRRFGTSAVTTASVLTTAVALLGFSASHGFMALCLYAIPLGLGAGSVDAALNNYVALHYKARQMSWLHCFWGIGASIGPLIMSAFLIHKNSWNLGYLAIGIIQVCLVALLFISTPLWRDKKIDETAMKNEPIKFAQLFRIAGVKQALVAFFCYCSIETTAGLWGGSYLVLAKGIAPEIAAQWTALYYVGITVGRFIAGFVTIKLNGRRMIRLGQGLIACGLVVLVLPFGKALLLPGLFIIGLGCAPIYPNLIHQTPENFGKEYSQAVIGIQMASAYLGTTLTPPVFGRIATIINFNVFPVFIGIMLALKIIMTEALNRKIDAVRMSK
jgi:fucose permease